MIIGKKRQMKYIEKALELLPRRALSECIRIFNSRDDYPSGLMEIRLRSPGRSSLLISGESVALNTRVTREDMEMALSRLSRGSLYAFRDTIREGYIPMEGGGRVGICGHARYDGDRCVGISDITSLVIRIPRPAGAIAREAARAILSGGGGALIYSPPCGGKTTALRSLAGLLGTGSGARRVVVVDERCEFNPEDYSDAQVDILRGYRRREGLMLAIKTMSPEVIIIDEIGSADEAELISEIAHSGASLIASAHAESLRDVLLRRSLRILIEGGIFKRLFRISKNELGQFEMREERWDENA